MSIDIGIADLLALLEYMRLEIFYFQFFLGLKVPLIKTKPCQTQTVLINSLL